MDTKLSAQQVEDLIHLGFAAKRKMLAIEDVRPGSVRVRLPYRDTMLRPGNVLSGPALFAAVDLVMYALVLSHIGPELMAVTSNVNLNFLAKAKPGDILGAGRMLKLGRRQAVMEALLYSSAEPETLVVHATGTYALPLKA